MVAIKAQQVAQFLKAPDRRIVAILVFGPDIGLVSERAQEAARRLAARETPAGEIVRIEDADLDHDPDRIHIELQTVAMFGGAKIVRTAASRKINAPFLKPLLEPGLIAGGLVVEAGNLRADEALRKLFEGAETAAALPCYADEARDIETLLRDQLGAAGLEIAPDARELLVSRLGADRALTRSEIAKLILYAHGAGRIEIADVEAIVGDASELAIDSILFAASAGDGRKAITELDRAVSAGESPQGIIVLTQRHFQRLHRLRGALDAGRSFEDAARAMRPPLFGKGRSMLESQVRAWDGPRLDRALAAISRAARDARLSGALEATIAERMLLELATMAGGRRR